MFNAHKESFKGGHYTNIVLQGIGKVVSTKDVCNLTPIIDVFMGLE
jgi:hypothetical protein